MDILLRSLLAGGAAAIILTVAKFGGPRLAGAVGGIPIIYAISYILITYNNKNEARNFLLGGINGFFASLLFIVSLLLLNYLLPKNHWLNFIIAYFACLSTAIVLTRVFTPGP